MVLQLLPATPVHSLHAQPAQAMVYIYNGPESELDTRTRYQADILTAILEKTRKKYGRYILKPAVPMTQDRQAYELAHNTGKITIIIRSANREYAGLFRYIPFAFDKDVLGYRVLLIHRGDQPQFSQVRSLEDLRAFSMGAQSDWKDVAILQANGLKVVSGHSYEGLFEMLEKGRFDALSRSVVEAGDEVEAHVGATPDLAIERSLLLYYPIPRYFWFSRDESGGLLAARVKEGLDEIVRDGTLDRIFQHDYAAELAALDLRRRRLIRLDNPLLPSGAADEPGHSQDGTLPSWFPRPQGGGR